MANSDFAVIFYTQFSKHWNAIKNDLVTATPVSRLVYALLQPSATQARQHRAHCPSLDPNSPDLQAPKLRILRLSVSHVHPSWQPISPKQPNLFALHCDGI